MSVNGQTILITGACGGLGQAAALALAKNGARIILLDNNVKQLEKVYDSIVAQQCMIPVMCPFDLAGANEEQYQDLADGIESKYGSLQGLLHSAVEFTGFMPIASHTTLDWWKTLQTNLTAPFILSRVLLPVLGKSTSASIVFTVDSIVDHLTAFSGAYGVSKSALLALSTILAEETESFNIIRVNTLIPGPVDSPFRKRAYPFERNDGLPKMDSLDTIYTYLFGPQSIGITGQTIDARTFKL